MDGELAFSKKGGLYSKNGSHRSDYGGTCLLGQPGYIPNTNMIVSILLGSKDSKGYAHHLKTSLADRWCGNWVLEPIRKYHIASIDGRTNRARTLSGLAVGKGHRE